MAGLYQYTLWLHAVAGLVGLVLFWIPMALRKGSPRHKRIGDVYLRLMWAAGLTGLLMALLLFLDPLAVKFPANEWTAERRDNVAADLRDRAWFFLLLAMLLIATVQRAKLSLVARANRQLLRRPLAIASPMALLMTGLIVAWLAITRDSVLFGVFGLLGVWVACGLLWYAYKPTLQAREWVIEHLGATIGSGIAAHTAFFVFGASSLFGELFAGDYMLIPWIAPGAVGGVTIIVLSNQYRRRFGIGAARPKAA